MRSYDWNHNGKYDRYDMEMDEYFFSEDKSAGNVSGTLVTAYSAFFRFIFSILGAVVILVIFSCITGIDVSKLPTVLFDMLVFTLAFLLNEKLKNIGL